MYKKQWTEFEVQALAYSILRKNLYPTHLVRGEYKWDSCRTDIAIFTNEEEPKLVCVVEVKKSVNGKSVKQGERYESLLGVPCVYVRGGDDAYNILNLVKSHL